MADRPDRRERINTIRTLGALSTVGFSFVLAVLIGALFGWWLDKLFKFARSPQGRQLTDKAKRYAQSPEGRRQIEQARSKLASKGKRHP